MPSPQVHATVTGIDPSTRAAIGILELEGERTLRLPATGERDVEAGLLAGAHAGDDVRGQTELQTRQATRPTVARWTAIGRERRRAIASFTAVCRTVPASPTPNTSGDAGRVGRSR